MKYYYISYGGPFRSNLTSSRDINRIAYEKNKIVITRIDSDFHVLLCRDGNYDDDKKVLSYIELVKFLKENKINSYFMNIDGEVAYNIYCDVKKGEFYDNTRVIPDVSNHLFTINDDCVLKIEVYLDQKYLKWKILEAFDKEVMDDHNYRTIGLDDLIENQELLKLYHFPVNEKYGIFTVPNYSYSKPNLFYLLSSIYKDGKDNITLSNDDINNLYIAKALNEKMVNDLLSKAEVRILKTYNLDEFNQALNFIDSYSKQEDDNYIKLSLMKRRLEDAKRNKKIVESLGILDDLNKDESFQKTRGVINE